MRDVTTWEYLVIPEIDRERLTSLGREGWELVAIGGGDHEQRLYFKRQAADLRERVTLEQRVHYYRSLGLDPLAAAEGQA